MTKFAFLPTVALEGKGNSGVNYLTGYCTVVDDDTTYVMKGSDLRYSRRNGSPSDDSETPPVYKLVRVIDSRACFTTVGEKRARKIAEKFLSKRNQEYLDKIPPPRVLRGRSRELEIESYDDTKTKVVGRYRNRISETGDLVQITVEWDSVLKVFVSSRKDYLQMREVNLEANGHQEFPEIFSFIRHDFDSDRAKIAPARNRVAAWQLALGKRARVD